VELDGRDAYGRLGSIAFRRIWEILACPGRKLGRIEIKGQQANKFTWKMANKMACICGLCYCCSKITALTHFTEMSKLLRQHGQ